MGLRTNPNVANKGLCFPHTTEQVEDQEHKPEHFVVPEGGGWGGGSGVSTLTKLPQPVMHVQHDIPVLSTYSTKKAAQRRPRSL